MDTETLKRSCFGIAPNHSQRLTPIRIPLQHRNEKNLWKLAAHPRPIPEALSGATNSTTLSCLFYDILPLKKNLLHVSFLRITRWMIIHFQVELFTTSQTSIAERLSALHSQMQLSLLEPLDWHTFTKTQVLWSTQTGIIAQHSVL
jgi:hypothetical protein